MEDKRPLKEVVISIFNSQNAGDDDADSFEFSTDGLYGYDGKAGYLMYYESEVTGLPGTKTCLFISDEEVILDRTGALTSRMIFKEGVNSTFIYDTPFGMANLGLNTGRVRHSFDEHGGRMEIDYVLNFESRLLSSNKFSIDVKEIGAQ